MSFDIPSAARKPTLPSPSQTLDKFLQAPSAAARTRCSSNICAICRDPLHDPRETPCGHLFCNDCIRHALSSSDHCPLCRTLLFARAQDTLRNTAIALDVPWLMPVGPVTQPGRSVKDLRNIERMRLYLGACCMLLGYVLIIINFVAQLAPYSRGNACWRLSATGLGFMLLGRIVRPDYEAQIQDLLGNGPVLDFVVLNNVAQIGGFVQVSILLFMGAAATHRALALMNMVKLHAGLPCFEVLDGTVSYYEVAGCTLAAASELSPRFWKERKIWYQF